MPQDIRSFFKVVTKKDSTANASSSNEKKDTGNLNGNSSDKAAKNETPMKKPAKEKPVKKDVTEKSSKKNVTSEKSPEKIKPKSKFSSIIDSDSEEEFLKSDSKSIKKEVAKKTNRKIDNAKLNKKEKNPIKKEKHTEDCLNEDDIIPETPVKTDRSKFSAIIKKRKAHVISSDSEDGNDSKPAKKSTTEKLKPVNVADMFKATVHQSKEKIKETVDKKSKKKSEKGTNDLNKSILDDDEDFFLQHEDILNKTIESAKVKVDSTNGVTNETKKSPTTFKTEKDDTSPKKKNDTPKKSNNSKKRALKSDDEETPSKKAKKEEASYSGIDPGQEAHEKKRYSAILYQKYLHRGAPKHLGSKELPEGNPDCLKNLTFLRTGVLDSLDSENFDEIIKKHGGRIVHAVSKKVNYIVVGEEPGPSKLAKAEEYKIPNITEDELLDLILVKSNKPKKYTVGETSKEEPKIESDLSPPSSSKENITAPSPKKKDDKIKKKIFEKTETKKPQEKEKKIASVHKIETSTKIDIPEIKVTNDALGTSFVDKYKPSDTKQIIGQQMSNSNMNRLREWLESWYINEKRRARKEVQMPKPWDKCNKGDYYKCALLSGPPGVGKTTTATLVAKSLGFDVVEFNASDTRSKKLLQEEVMNILSSNTLTAYNQVGLNKEKLKKRVLLMDEVDGMAGNEDRGGVQELISLIKTSKIPIICMCNDRYHNKIKSLANYCYDLRFEKPKPQQILGLVMSISCKEGIKIDPKIAMEVIKGTDCDIRQTLNQMTMIANCETDLTLEDAQKESNSIKKDTVFGPWQVCRKVFSESEQKEMSLIDKSRLFFYDYSIGPLFVQENYLKVTPKVKGKKELMKRVAAAAEAISMGAVIDQKIRETNTWSLLDMESMFASVIPGYQMSGSVPVNIDFPSWLGKTSKRSKLKRITTELTTHTNLHTSGGSLAMALDYSKPLFTSIVRPLKKDGLDGVPKAISIMKKYQLLREDLEGLAELSTWSKQKSLWESVEGKVKAAFTRNYNKEVPMYAHSAAGVSKKKTVALSGEDMYNEDGDEEDNQDEESDKIENDKLIKAKVRTNKNKEPPSSKASTSKKGTGGKGRNRKAT